MYRQDKLFNLEVFSTAIKHDVKDNIPFLDTVFKREDKYLGNDYRGFITYQDLARFTGELNVVGDNMKSVSVNITVRQICPDHGQSEIKELIYVVQVTALPFNHLTIEFNADTRYWFKTYFDKAIIELNREYNQYIKDRCY